MKDWWAKRHDVHKGECIWRMHGRQQTLGWIISYLFSFLHFSIILLVIHSSSRQIKTCFYASPNEKKNINLFIIRVIDISLIILCITNILILCVLNLLHMILNSTNKIIDKIHVTKSLRWTKIHLNSLFLPTPTYTHPRS